MLVYICSISTSIENQPHFFQEEMWIKKVDDFNNAYLYKIYGKGLTQFVVINRLVKCYKKHMIETELIKEL